MEFQKGSDLNNQKIVKYRLTIHTEEFESILSHQGNIKVFSKWSELFYFALLSEL